MKAANNPELTSHIQNVAQMMNNSEEEEDEEDEDEEPKVPKEPPKEVVSVEEPPVVMEPTAVEMTVATDTDCPPAVSMFVETATEGVEDQCGIAEEQVVGSPQDDSSEGDMLTSLGMSSEHAYSTASKVGSGKQLPWLHCPCVFIVILDLEVYFSTLSD